MYNLNDRFSLGGTESLMRTIATYTFVCELSGMLLMFPGFLIGGFGFFRSLWLALFYSVGSFCNAGIGPLFNDIAHQAEIFFGIRVNIAIKILFNTVQRNLCRGIHGNVSLPLQT